MSQETDETILIGAALLVALLMYAKQKNNAINNVGTSAQKVGGAATQVINALGGLFKGLSGSSGTSTPTNPANTGYNPSASQAGASASAAQTSDTGNTDFPYFGAPPSAATDDGVAYNPPNASPYDAMSYA